MMSFAIFATTVFVVVVVVFVAVFVANWKNPKKGSAFTYGKNIMKYIMGHSKKSSHDLECIEKCGFLYGV